MLTMLKDWFVLILLRIVHALGWPVWLLVLIGVVVVPIAAVRTYFWIVKRALEASE